MNPSRLFWKMVRHEFQLKGSWKRHSHPHLSKEWVLLYLGLIVIVGAGLTTYYALQHPQQLNKLWFVLSGFPYVMIVFGVAILKREWENQTYGWWLTLPFSRLWLISVKWIAVWLRLLALLFGIFALLSMYVVTICLTLNQYTMAEAGSFMLTGLLWVFLMIGFGPFLLAASLLMTGVQYSSLRPLSPILWVCLVAGISYAYRGLNTYLPDSLSVKYVMEATRSLWEVPVGMVISWLVAFLLLRLTSYLLDRKLTL